MQRVFSTIVGFWVTVPSLGLKGHLWVVAPETYDAVINSGFLVLASVSLYVFYLALTYERHFRKR